VEGSVETYRKAKIMRKEFIGEGSGKMRIVSKQWRN